MATTITARMGQTTGLDLQGWRLAVAILGLAGMYWAAGKLGGMMIFVGTNVSSVWPASGIALAGLLLLGLRAWPGIYLGSLVLVWPMPGFTPPLLALGSVLEAVVAALVLHRLGFQMRMERLRDVLALGLAGAVGSIMAAANGVGWMCLAERIPWSAVPSAGWTWWIGDTMGILVLTPMICVWTSQGWRPWRRWSVALRLEAAVLAITTAAVGVAVFASPLTPMGTSSPVAFLAFPMAIWAALRLGPAGATISALLLGLIAVMGTMQGQGPFTSVGDLSTRMLALQMLLATLTLSALVLAAVIGERATAEAELVLTSVAIEHAGDLVFWIRLDGSLIHANPAAAKRLGHAVGRFTDMPFANLVAEHDAGGFGDGWCIRWLDGGALAVRELTLKTAGGATFPVEIAFSKVDDPRLLEPCLCAIARDLGERKAMEARLVQAGKMEALGRLAGGIAHDFNNLLAVINGYAETGAQRLAPSHPARLPLERIHAAGERAADLTKQLLAFSRKQVLQPRTLDLRSVVDEAGPLLARLFDNNIVFQVEPGSQPAWVRADPTQLQQVAINLALNARDAMAQGGTLRIAVETIALDPLQTKALATAHPHDAEAMKPGVYAVLIVEDTGQGMEPQVLARLFEPFFTTKPTGKGTGLGLAMAHGIVLQSGGFLTVSSTPGKGTRMRVHLPLKTTPDASTPVPVLQAVTASHGRILVVEDEPVVRDLLTEQLAEDGHAVTAARDAAEALRLAENGAFDLLVTDVMMPGMSGPALAERLRERQPQLRVLFVSGYSENRFPGATPPAGTHFLAKPFRHEDLLAVVRKALR